MIAHLRPAFILPRLNPETLRFAAWLLGWWLVGFCPTGLLVWLTA